MSSQLGQQPSTQPSLQEQAANFDFAAYQQQNNVAVDLRPQTEDVLYEESVTFQSMGLSLGLLQGIADCGFRFPSPVQAQAIPKVLMGNDVIARAKNGTGKTAAFCIPIIQQIDVTKNNVQAIILASTRELVTQIGQFLAKLTKHLKVKVLSSYGGNEFKTDLLALQQGVHILVATSGRVETIQSLGFLDNVKICAIDEADKFFDGNSLPFTTELFTRILRNDCAKILFSATYPKSLQPFIKQYLPNASYVNTMDEITLRGVTQHYLVVEEKDKVKFLRQLLTMLKIDQCIIFCCSPQRAEALAQRMSTKWQIPCFAISSALTQKDRTTISTQFRNKAFKYLIATDVLARGFDIASVNVVINFDLTPSPETYLHRIGRSGRFGHLGLAINLVNPNSGDVIKQYEDKLGTQITQLPQVIDHDVYSSQPAPPAQGQ